MNNAAGKRSDAIRDITEPGWREREAAAKKFFDAIPQQEKGRLGDIQSIDAKVAALTAERDALQARLDAMVLRGEPEGWLIKYTLGGVPTVVFSRHNSLGDYREFDSSATSTPVYAADNSTTPEQS